MELLLLLVHQRGKHLQVSRCLPPLYVVLYDDGFHFSLFSRYK